MPTTLVAALTKGSATLSHSTCFGCGQKVHCKRDFHKRKGYRAQIMSHHEENLLKFAHDAVKAVIGLKIVNPNIMQMGDF
jgi:hypothetical protein